MNSEWHIQYARPAHRLGVEIVRAKMVFDTPTYPGQFGEYGQALQNRGVKLF